MKRCTGLLAMLLAALLLISACTAPTSPRPHDPIEFSVDKDGLLTWTAVPGAVAYEFSLAAPDGTLVETREVTETSFPMPPEHSAVLRAKFADGSYGDTYTFEPTPNAITVDANGYASWPAVEGALHYRYVFSDTDSVFVAEGTTQDTGIQLPAGCRAEVCPVFADGSVGASMLSDFFGEAEAAVDPADILHPDYTVLWSRLTDFDLIAAMDPASLQQQGDTVTFTALSPEGSTLRFAGSGVTVEEGRITFAPGSRLTLLDAIGRVCAVTVKGSHPDNRAWDLLEVRGGYTFTDATAVSSADELFLRLPAGADGASINRPEGFVMTEAINWQANFIAFEGAQGNEGDLTVDALILHYDTATYATPLRAAYLNSDFYSPYLEGERYDASRERFDMAGNIMDFYIVFLPALLDERVPLQPDPLNRMFDIFPRAVACIDDDRYTVGALRDAHGNELDKANAHLTPGCTLDITLEGGAFTTVEVPLLPRFTGAATQWDLQPDANQPSSGHTTSLVVPVVWHDQPENATQAALEDIRRELGRVAPMEGEVTDCTDHAQNGYSVSEYYDLSSYGKHRVDFVLTDWYHDSRDFADTAWISANDTFMIDEVTAWLYATYPDADFSRFDRDANGIIDSLILVNTGDITVLTAPAGSEVGMHCYYGAAEHTLSSIGERRGTPHRPAVNNYITICTGSMAGNTLIHEYGHTFGLIDYYDTSYSGIDAVGSYDMMSLNMGDHNAFSKYSLGWLEPEVVEDLAPGESVDITLGAMSITGDAVVIPAAGTAHGGPFGEYLLIDLFTDAGLNAMEAEALGLKGAAGVRIYHVNAAMEQRTVTSSLDGESCTIGTVRYGNGQKDNGLGIFHIELLQAGGQNTFTGTGSRMVLAKEDLFTAGDTFDAADHGAFLHGGLMDDGTSFGYTVSVVSVEGSGENAAATLRITRK